MMDETQKRLERVAEGLRVGRVTTDVARIAAAMVPREEKPEEPAKLHSLWDLMKRGK